MRTKLPALILASLVGTGAMFMMPAQASAFAVPAAQRDAVNQALATGKFGTGTEGLYEEVRHRRWQNRRYRDRRGWRHRRQFDGYSGYYPRRRHWRNRYRYRDYDYYGGYGYGRPGIYFGFGL